MTRTEREEAAEAIGWYEAQACRRDSLAYCPECRTYGSHQQGCPEGWPAPIKQRNEQEI